MDREEYVRDTDGKITHIRVTAEDGRTSWLYEHDDSVGGELLYGGRGKCVEVAEHGADGTTQAYEKDDSVLGELFRGGKGKAK